MPASRSGSANAAEKHVGSADRRTPVAAAILWVICIVSLTVQMTVFSRCCISPSRSILVSALLAGAEFFIVLCPFPFLKGKWRFAVLIPCVAVSLYLIVAVPYFEAFGDMVALRAFFQPASYNEAVFASGASLLGLRNYVMMAAALAPLVYAVSACRRIARGVFPKSWLLGTPAAASAAFFCGSYLYSVISYGDRNPARLADFFRMGVYDRVKACQTRGLVYANALEIGHLPVFFSPLSEQEDAAFRSYVARKREWMKRMADADTHSGGCAGMNVVLIVVESLSSEALLRDYNGFRAMPFLRSLTGRDNAATFTDVKVQVDMGRSSDGQLMYNTGLLPIRSEAYSLFYADSPLPSLAKAAGYPAREVIGESGSVWNHAATSVAFGYGALRQNTAAGYGKSPGKSKDALIFDEALKEIDLLRKEKTPFFLEITTMEMHGPYLGEEQPERDGAKIAGMDPSDRSYLYKCRRFDRALEKFLRELERRGLLDRTLTVIASDHDPDSWGLKEMATDHIPIILLNSGYSGISGREVRQIDLYSTMLRLMGCGDYPWPGLGRDLFLPVTSAEPLPGDVFLRRKADADTLWLATRESLWRMSERLLTTRSLPAM